MIAVLATICHLATVLPTTPVDAPPAETCEDITIASDETTTGLSMLSCQITGQQQILEWMREHPIYSHRFYRLAGWKCVLGKRAPEIPA